jgi:hypothetical protein
MIPWSRTAAETLVGGAGERSSPHLQQGTLLAMIPIVEIAIQGTFASLGMWTARY